MSTKTLIDNDHFTLLLRKFNTLVENMPPVANIAPNLADIRQEAIDSNEMNARQKEAITARCDNYTAGTYGSWSKPYDVHNHVKSSK